jgi:serine/threonine protein phosphatase PrpC
LNIYSRTDIGLVRSTNQDSFQAGMLSEKAAWAVVCDGMGGANGGNIASQKAVEVIAEQVTSSYRSNMTNRSIQNMLISAAYNANTSIYEHAEEDPLLKGMGATLVLALAEENRLSIVHAGDSRAYLIHNGRLKQLTKDHSIVQQMVDSGEITSQQARVHPRKNIITRALGVEPLIQVDYNEYEFPAGSLLLICTDGLSNYLDEDALLQYHANTQTAFLADRLVERAKELGGSDNITVVILSK